MTLAGGLGESGRPIVTQARRGCHAARPVAEDTATLLELRRCAGGRSRGAGGAVAHLGERFNGIEEAGGSSPPSSTTAH